MIIMLCGGSNAHAGRSSLFNSINTQRPERNSLNHVLDEDEGVTKKCPYKATTRCQVCKCCRIEKVPSLMEIFARKISSNF